ncbi:MAG: glycosyl hydrolase family protein [Phycisphaera sp.]|nr:MAG: glycosyl hydrolase family protein [Phycisphaera sp.]
MYHRKVAHCVWFLSVSASAQTSYEIYWQDEFDGTQLDTQSWSYMIGDGSLYGIPGWGNNELQYYTDRGVNSVVSDGTLKIIARRENFGGMQYTSARIRTKDNIDFTYGKVEASLRLPSTPGIWPALWMLPTESPYGGWAAGGEIDIMESVNYADRIYGTIHHGGQWPDNVSAGGSYAPGIDFSQGFHTYTMEWDPDTIRWYVDGNLYRSLSRTSWYSLSAPENERAPFDTDFHLLINCAVGGNFPGNPNGASVFPQTYELDWIRVYRRVQAPFGGTPAQIPGVIEAERFDEGYPAEAYFDCDIGNAGGQFRSDVDVDIEAIPGGGFNVGYLCPGEWIEYTVDVAQTGTYTGVARVASQVTNGAFRLEVDGADISGRIEVPFTGGWQSYIDLPISVQLEAGQHVIRLRTLGFTGEEFNIDSITLDPLSPDCLADTNGDGVLSPADFTAWIAAYNAAHPACDQNGDGSCTPADFTSWIDNFNAGCP